METYRVILADPDVSVREHTKVALEDAGQSVVAVADNLAELETAYREHRPEVVLLGTELLPLPVEVRELIEPSALVLLRNTEIDTPTRERIAESAAFATLCRPINAEDVSAELALAVNRNADLRECHMELDKVQTRLADRIVIEKAKGLLIRHEGIAEPEAFKQIHFTARKANRTMRNVAEEIIARYSEESSEA